MGCNCGGTKTANLTYVYTNAQGRTTVYRTEIEAKAAVLRGGGSYTTAASAR